MNVVLISPPSRIMNHYRPPLALMYLAGFLKKNGVSSKIIDITLKKQIRDKVFYRNKEQYLANVEEDILNRLALLDTDIIGITCYTPELSEVEELAQKIKRIKTNIKIIAGGIHPTLYPHDFLKKDSPFTAVIIGEGEVAFLELVKALRSGMNLNAVKGIGYFDEKASRAVITESQELADNLDDISFPDYEDLDMEYYTTASPYAIRGVFTRSFYLSSSRGCPSSCTFCVSKKLREYHGIKQFVRLRSPHSLYDEVVQLKKRYQIDAFYFIDDLFTLKKQNVFEFCELLRKNRSGLIWGCSSKVNTVDFKVLKAMRDAGCVQIDFGVEKGSDEALKYLKKEITISQVKATFANCHKLGLRTFANMLVNTPGETEKDLNDMIRLIEEIKPEIVSFNVFTPYPGCEIYDSFCCDIIHQDYPLLMQDPNTLIEKYPKKFRFASHTIDLRSWVMRMMKKYNKVLPNAVIFLNGRYLRSLLRSGHKSNYVVQLASLAREVVLQKF